MYELTSRGSSGGRFLFGLSTHDVLHQLALRIVSFRCGGSTGGLEVCPHLISEPEIFGGFDVFVLVDFVASAVDDDTLIMK